MASTRSPATIKSVAARAGVSTATVSRVLHNNGYVAPKTRKRVEGVLRDSGYRLDAVAQALRRQRTITLGLILHGILPNPFFAEVAMGVEQAAVEHGFNVLMFNTDGDPKREREGVESLLGRRVDGVIFTTALRAENVELVLDAGVPAVEAERRLCERAPAVVIDNYAGAREAMAHLLDLGHERIGYIGEADTFQEPDGRVLDRVRRERFAGYREALEEAGIHVSEAHLIRGQYPLEPGGWGGVGTGRDYMQALLEQAPTITAVLAASDLLAAGALQTLYERSIRVPTQISIVGFDDTFASRLAPPLTTVRQPMFEMGLRAGHLAIRLLEEGTVNGGEDADSIVTEWCKTSLVVRQSTAPPGS
jgi:DNA-binding LacI/PurR family transcriptional regulator